MELNVRLSDATVIYDTDPEQVYLVLVSKNGPIVAKTILGVRFSVPMHEPGQKFFTAVAKNCHRALECSLVMEQGTNRVGAYFVRKRVRK